MLTDSKYLTKLSSNHLAFRMFILFVAIFFVSCTDHSFIDDLLPGKSITFSTDLSTRGNLYLEPNNSFKTMGVFASYQGPEDFDDLTEVSYLLDQALERDNGSSGWHYSPSKVWNSGKHSFFAYAPHSSSSEWKANPPTIDHIDGYVFGTPMMNYTVPLSVSNQTDLLVAAAQYNLIDTLSSSVKLVMNHALTRIVFSARVNHPVHVDSAITVTNIEFQNVKYNGSRLMDYKPSYTWTTTTDIQSFVATQSDGLLSIPLDQSYKHLNTPTGNLFMMPQSFLNSNANLRITYRTYLKSDVNKYKDVVVTKKMEDILDSWNQGESVRFLFTIPNSAQPADFVIQVNYVPWDDRNTNVSIPSDPFLDISNVEVKTFDAAATRIYFYTNQRLLIDGKPNVYIEPQGRKGSNIGAMFEVQNEFQGLVGDTPATSYNFHFDDATGKGHIDLINVNTLLSGDRPSNGKELLVLKLRAGKLIRDITVQPVVTAEAAKQNAIRYVGTFHRHKEIGERIITWHLPSTTSWTATIVEEATSNHSDLCLDRLVSPDFDNYILYSYQPRDAEGAIVSQEVKSVKGTGRVYFRVGWKSTSLLTNRYARIMVTETTSEGVSTNHFIYCRQGETEDPITGAAKTYFAVYNTAQPRSFTQYPSQVGMGYQWNRMKAWEPLSISAPPGFPLYPGTPPYVYDILLPFSPENNACPEGYLYPNQNALNEMKTILINYPNNFQWGYYADGFFDRRKIEIKDNRVEGSTLDVASAGYVLSAPAGSPKSIFLSTGGDRDDNGVLHNVGATGVYWSQEAVSGDDENVQVGVFNKPGYGSSTVDEPHEKWHTHSLRCIKPDANKAWIVRFDANKGANAPASITVPFLQTSDKITLPTAIPNSYFRPDYDFKGWNTKADGTGYTYNAGGVYDQGALSATSIPATAPSVITLYAVWVKNPYLKLDFRLFMSPSEQSSYLLSSGSYNSYVNSSGQNGSFFSTSSNAISGEKAYPNLKWTIEQPFTQWALAYSNCKNLPEDGGGWRLPRFSELHLVSNASNISALKGKVTFSNFNWSGTQSDASNSWIINSTGLVVKNSITSSLPYRCVKEIPR